MSSSNMLSSLNLATLLIGLAVAAVALALFLRKRSNRHPLENKTERNIAADLDKGRSPDESFFQDLK